MDKLIIKGTTIDDETRCVHYHSPSDIVAIKFKCCNNYYPCFQCHAEETNHQMIVWMKNEFDTKAILCGICKKEMTIKQYLNSNNRCIFCDSRFNPDCCNHYSFYFDL